MAAGPGARKRTTGKRRAQSRAIAMEERGEGMRQDEGRHSGRKERKRLATTPAEDKRTAQRKEAGAHKERRDTREAQERTRRTESKQ